MSRNGFRADYSNQTAFFDPSRFGYPLTVIGCGGIGASALPTLATLGVPEITLWDDDMVEPRNVAATILFGPDDVGQPKVEVAQRELRRLGTPNVTVHRERFDPDLHGDQLSGVVISAVDSMAVRKQIWRAVGMNPMVALLLDGRIGGEQFELDIVRPCELDDVEWYESFQLFDDSDAAPLPCAERNVVYPSAALGAHMASRIALFARSQPTGRQIIMHMRTQEIMTL